MSPRFIPAALMLGNFAVGTSILAPTGMLPQLAEGFAISVRNASLLITLGALVLCIGTPLISWATSRTDRRVLLVSSLAVVAVAQLLGALTTSFWVLLASRLVMVAAAAPFTPQSAGVIGLLVPIERRASSIAFIFLGWSLAAALGVPIVAALAGRFGWATPLVVIGCLSALSCALVAWRLPRALSTAPVNLAAWLQLVRSKAVRLLLLLTVLLMAGQFVVLTFAGPLLARLTHATPDQIGLAFALFGLAGFIGNAFAARTVEAWGAFRMSVVTSGLLALGLSIWAVSAGSYLGMVVGMGVWGLGFASTNSMQQARLVASAPLYAGASVALNSSSLYVGQAIGSAIGGVLFERGLDHALGYGGVAFMLAALLVLVTTRPAPDTSAFVSSASSGQASPTLDSRPQ
jgi:MFS transporter, DHA1 family, inner membrane transport protein